MDPPKYDDNVIQKHLWILPSKRTEHFQRINKLAIYFNVDISFITHQRYNLTITGAPYNVEAACARINTYVDFHDLTPPPDPSRHNPPTNDRQTFDELQRSITGSSNSVSSNVDGPSTSTSTHVYSSSDSTLPNIVDPSELASSKSTFVQPTFECSVCFESLSIDENFVTCSMDSVSEAASGNDKTHAMCLPCIKSYAHSSITGSSIAFGGIGLKCVEPECKNAFLLSSFVFCIDINDRSSLQNRLQQQCLADANLKDLVTCSGCGLKMCVSDTMKNYICNCGRNNCRSCPRAFDGKHSGKTCKELDEEEANDVSLRNLESKMSEVVIRKCHKCGINFVKAEGCNKMECTCGATQCYICNKQGIKYDHFCRCGNTNEQHGPCSACRKSCRNWENFEDLDNKKINEILSSADPLLEKNKQPQFNKIVTPPENSRQRFAGLEDLRIIRPRGRFFRPPQMNPTARPQVVPAALRPTRPRAEQIEQRRNDLFTRPFQRPEALARPQQQQVARNGNPQRNIYQQRQPQFPFRPQLPQQANQVIPQPRSIVPRLEQTVRRLNNPMFDALTHPPSGFTLPQANGNNQQQHRRRAVNPPQPTGQQNRPILVRDSFMPQFAQFQQNYQRYLVSTMAPQAPSSQNFQPALPMGGFPQPFGYENVIQQPQQIDQQAQPLPQYDLYPNVFDPNQNFVYHN